VLAAAERARAKNLGILAGTWRRHDRAYRETVQRIRDGAIGRVVGANVYFVQGGLAEVRAREPGWSDVEWQIRNFPFFTWLSGDFIVEHHVHQHDVANWVLGGPPRLCIAMGGRQGDSAGAIGDTYDHFATDFEYADGTHVASFCRQVQGTAMRVGERVFGTNGWADASGKIHVDGDSDWKYKGPVVSAWTQMHADLIASIRAGRPINEGKDAAESHLTAIMARMSAYTGQLLRWSDASRSELNLMPAQLEFGPMPIPTVAVPGRNQRGNS
jgi:predicted dehydrogenase